MSVRAQIHTMLAKSVSVAPARASAFFKTGVGQYAAEDMFMGVTVPTLRKISKEYNNLDLEDIQHFLQSQINEERLLALIILTMQYHRSDEQNQDNLYGFYVKNLHYVNNWNLVDASAHLIIGAHLYAKEHTLLDNLAKSSNLWERRISIVSTWYFIRKDDLEWTFKLASMLLKDRHDLIHKAVGWMLREAGKRDESALITFLDQHATHMPRTMLRYAIEKFPQSQRKSYLLKKKTVASH